MKQQYRFSKSSKEGFGSDLFWTRTEIKSRFLDWMKRKNPEWLDYNALYLAAHWLTEIGLVPESETDLWDIDELTADIKWEYIKGVCHEQ